MDLGNFTIYIFLPPTQKSHQTQLCWQGVMADDLMVLMTLKYWNDLNNYSKNNPYAA